MIVWTIARITKEVSMARVALVSSICFGVVSLSACTGAPAQSNADETVSAVIVNPTDRSRASLHNVVRKALSRESVLLSDEALTEDSVLVVEPQRIRDSAGQLLTDSSVRVERFQLLKRGDECLLVHERTGQRYSLAETTCVAKE
jgi:hypothetical protein